MTYELAKQLKDAGFPQKQSEFYWRLGYHTSESFEKGISTGREGIFSDTFTRTHFPYPRYRTADVKWNERDLAKLDETEVADPTLSELIEACGDEFFELQCFTPLNASKFWQAHSTSDIYQRGSTPAEAVANLYLALKK